jgi:hypothetical protein
VGGGEVALAFGRECQRAHLLTRELRACGWPCLAKPSHPAIHSGSTGDGGTPPEPPCSPGPVVRYTVHPGAFCAEHGYYGYTSAGTLMRCVTTATDSRYRWQSPSYRMGGAPTRDSNTLTSNCAAFGARWVTPPWVELPRRPAGLSPRWVIRESLAVGRLM